MGHPGKGLAGAALTAREFAGGIDGEFFSYSVRQPPMASVLLPNHSDRDQAKPFFAYLAFHESHEPVAEWAPEKFRKPYLEVDEEAFASIEYGGPGVERRAKLENRAAYYGCVAQLDAAIGDLVAHLKETGQWEKTFFHFSSDNGPEHRSATSWGTPGALRGAKGHLHEGGIKVPGLAVWPGQIAPGTTSAVPVHAWDALPTFCELAGIAPPDGIDGVSFLPATRGEAIERETPLYWSWYNARGGTNYIMLDGDCKLLAIAAPQPEGRGVVEHIKSCEMAGYQLYHLVEDPNKTEDLSGSRPGVMERLKARFEPLHRGIVSEGPVVRMNGDGGETQKGARKKKGKDEDR